LPFGFNQFDYSSLDYIFGCCATFAQLSRMQTVAFKRNRLPMTFTGEKTERGEKLCAMLVQR